MKTSWSRFAPIGLYLALLGALAAGVLYVLQREWNLYVQISLGVVLIGLALFAILDPERVRVALTGRQARYGSNAAIMALAFLGILVVANYLVYKNSKRWDLTEEKQNTLLEESVSTLEGLPQPVTAQAFFTARSNRQTAEGLLEQYEFNGKGKFDYRFIDPEADPIAAQNAGITRDATLVLQMGDRKETVTLISEQEITGALVRLISNETPKVYFLFGHGERTPDDEGDESYSTLKQTLESKNYQVETLNLLAANQIPEDARVIVIGGPKQPVSSQEIDQIKSFLDSGGSLIVLSEPLPVTDFGDSQDPLADYLAESWNILLGKDIVVDLTSQQPFIAVANQYNDHAITQKLQGLVTFFPTARSVVTRGDGATARLQELVMTSQNSWAETSLDTLQSQGDQQPQIQPDEGVDQIGPVSLAAVAESADGNARLVVFGDSEFAINANFDQYGNGDLLVNAIDWAAEQENLINLTPREPVQRLMVPPQQFTTGLIFLASVVLLPGLMLVAGIAVYIQRRKRG